MSRAHAAPKFPRWVVAPSRGSREVLACLAGAVPERVARAAAMVLARDRGRSLVLSLDRGARSNPTLVHHGWSAQASHHVLEDPGGDGAPLPLADLYGLTPRVAHLVAQALASGLRKRVMLMDNAGLPPSLPRHPALELGPGPRAPRLPNPAEPVVGQVWSTTAGARVRIVGVDAKRIQVLRLEDGAREWLDRAEFAAVFRAPRAPRQNPKPGYVNSVTATPVFQLATGVYVAAWEDGRGPRHYMARSQAERALAKLPDSQNWEVYRPATRRSFQFKLRDSELWQVRGTVGNPAERWALRGTLTRVRSARGAKAPRPAPAPTKAPALAVVPPAAPRKKARAGKNLQPGERVTVPYMGRASYFGRPVKKSRERATVVGYVDDNGKPGVLVSIQRGRREESHTVSEHLVRRAPSRGGSRARASAKLAERMEREFGDNLTLAQAELREAEQQAAKAEADAKRLDPSASDLERRAYNAARAKLRQQLARAEALQPIVWRLGGRVFDPDALVAAIGNPTRRGAGVKTLGPQLLRALGFDAVAREVEAGQRTLVESLQFVLRSGLLPESRKVLVRTALAALERGHSSTHEIAATKAAAHAALAREMGRRKNPAATTQDFSGPAGTARVILTNGKAWVEWTAPDDDGGLLNVASPRAAEAFARKWVETADLAAAQRAATAAPGGGPAGRRNNPALRWERLGPGKLRFAAPEGDYYVTAQHNQARRLVGYAVTLNTHQPNAQGWYWTLLPDKNKLADAKRVVAEEHARRVAATLGPKGNPKRHAAAGKRGGKGADPNRDTTRARRPRRNPGRSEMARGRRTFRRWHEFGPSRVSKVKGPPRQIPGTLVKLGEIHSLCYYSDKYAGGPDNPKGKTLLYEHATNRPRPVLATDPDGRAVYIVGGKMKVTADGLVN